MMMKRILPLLAAPILALGAVPAHAATIGQLIPGHSHWDVKTDKHELKVCYTMQATPTAGASSTIAFIPHREVDSQNFMELDIIKTGFQLKRRVAGVFTIDTPDPAVPNPGLSFGTIVGQEIMFDFTMDGPDFTVYQLNLDGTRGTKWFHWTDSTYPTGVNISYYTNPHYFGRWDFVHGAPLPGGLGWPHEISGIMQDARNHPAISTGENTFDDPTPASGGVTGVTGVTSATFGLASGANYTYTLTTTSTAATFDVRDPATPEDQFFASDWYRVKTTSPLVVEHHRGSSLLATHTASSGGAGSYTIVLVGSAWTVKNAAGTTILAFNDGAPASGVRVRVNPGTGTLTWTGTVNP